jgi:hypothetical protein
MVGLRADLMYAHNSADFLWPDIFQVSVLVYVKRWHRFKLVKAGVKQYIKEIYRLNWQRPPRWSSLPR